MADRNYKPKKCPTCQLEFKGFPSKKYCSDICKYGVKNCSVCGKEIIRKVKKNNVNGYYCSTTCFYKDENAKDRITLIPCPQCKNMFKPGYAKQKFCSVECGYKSNEAQKISFTCKTCGKEFLSRTNRLYCSQLCTTKSINKKSQPIGKTRLTQAGYIEIKTNDGWMLHHRFVMENILGRKLLKIENVHHKNGIRSDNSIDNLELWVKPQTTGQRVKDLVNFVINNYKKEIIEKLNI